MSYSHPNHHDIVATTEMAIHIKGEVKFIITEYRADGCVTWRAK